MALSIFFFYNPLYGKLASDNIACLLECASRKLHTSAFSCKYLLQHCVLQHLLLHCACLLQHLLIHTSVHFACLLQVLASFCASTPLRRLQLRGAGKLLSHLLLLVCIHLSWVGRVGRVASVGSGRSSWVGQVGSGRVMPKQTNS